MTVAKLIELLLQYPHDTPICVADKRGIRKLYTDPVFLSLHKPVLGEPFLVIDTDQRKTARKDSHA